jgi:DNA-binding CsgD family transcriptional regulator
MDKTIEQLQRENEKLLDKQHFVEEALDYKVLMNHIPFLKSISELSNSAIMIFDLFRREHVYVSENISRLFDLDITKTIGNPGYLNERIHPDDLPGMYEAGLYFLSYAFSLTPEHHKDFKLVSEYRMLSNNDRYIRIIEQQICLEDDCFGNVWLALGIMDISPDQSVDALSRSRLIDTTNGNVYLFPPPDKEAMLTTREREILQLIARGLISKQIADKLYISVNTVNTHRQRILEKLQAENSVEAIKYAERLGLI